MSSVEETEISNCQALPEQLSIALVSLGCPKNLVDSENMTALLQSAGWQMVNDVAVANVIIVNTCGFIESAVREGIDTILEMADYKANGKCDFLIVTGCLSQRYYREFAESLPEVDAVLGTGSYYAIKQAIKDLYCNASKLSLPLIYRSTDPADRLRHLLTDHPVSTGAYAYLKIAEGCDNRCAYCAIPSIRGQLTSRPIEELIAEAKSLVQRGVSELILVGQDTTSYGRDLYGKRKLADLMKQLCAISGLEQIRFLYGYADGMTDQLLHVMATEPKIVPYIDLPIQHASDAVLKRMNRSDREGFLRETFSRIRKFLPKAVLRTTVMVGFPGETAADFETLCQFVKDIKFHHLGCFVFSPEQGTAAYEMDDPVPEVIASERYDVIMSIQKEITAAHNKALIGKERSFLVEGVADDGIFYVGRIPEQAPEIDSMTYVASEIVLTRGQRYPITIVEAEAYELTGVCSEFT
ncbi:MAG: 30S ribosomal protein S12 methylthiotransferase RimO [Fastidiosipilaceae bacterium]|jgi:ribosomal protein S12 methylthiotransferase|nr:30S ribosomal protein S12 methylthiotransferase RimO [Clostridiaceae bacterium]